MASQLGVNLVANEPVTCFPHPAELTQNVFIFLDACHMVKLMRNMLAATYAKMLVLIKLQTFWFAVEELLI